MRAEIRIGHSTGSIYRRVPAFAVPLLLLMWLAAALSCLGCGRSNLDLASELESVVPDDSGDPGTDAIASEGSLDAGALDGDAAADASMATIASITLTPSSARVAIKATVAFAAVATLTDGTARDITVAATWTTSTPSIATVAAGIATGLSAGSTNITAHVGAISGTARLTVTSASLVSIDVTPTNPVLGVQVSIPFTATGTYSDGTVGDVTATAIWLSSSPPT